jgi:membrane protease YdiL (CAAX protease family)
MSGSHNLVSDKSPLYSLALVFFSVLFGFGLIGPLIGVQLGYLFYDGDLMAEMVSMKPNDDPGFFYAMMVAQGAATLIGLIVIPFLLLQANQKSLTPFFPPAHRWPFVLVLLALLGFNYIVAMSPIVEWNATLELPEALKEFEEMVRAKEDQLAEFTKAVTQFHTVPDMLLGLLVIALLPAIGEELVFRGLIQNEFWRGTRNIHVAIWVSAFIFSAIHMQFFGIIPRLLLGALFGYLYYWSGNLIVPMFAHFFNNAFSVIAIFLQNRQLIDVDVEKVESAPWPAVLVSVVLVALLMVYLWRFFRQYYRHADAAPRADFE